MLNCFYCQNIAVFEHALPFSSWLILRLKEFMVWTITTGKQSVCGDRCVNRRSVVAFGNMQIWSNNPDKNRLISKLLDFVIPEDLGQIQIHNTRTTLIGVFHNSPCCWVLSYSLLVCFCSSSLSLPHTTCGDAAQPLDASHFSPRFSFSTIILYFQFKSVATFLTAETKLHICSWLSSDVLFITVSRLLLTNFHALENVNR